MKYNAFIILSLMVCLSVVYADDSSILSQNLKRRSPVRRDVIADRAVRSANNEHKLNARGILDNITVPNITISACQMDSDCTSQYMCLKPISGVAGICTPRLTGAGTINGYHVIYTLILSILALILL